MAAVFVAGWLAGVLPGPGVAGAPDSGEVPAGTCGLAEAAKVGGLSSYPPCFEVELSADASGRPPLTYTWTLPDGTILFGNSLTLDTGLLSDGFQEIRLEVRNSAGVAEFPVHLVVEALGFSTAPSLTPVGDGVVEFRANTTGATEWRWTWGDGTSSGWASGCAGYTPSHLYPGPGSYSVTVEARSCRGGPVSWSGVLEVADGAPPRVERFRVVCPTAPFCTFGVGEPASFELEASGTAVLYAYDWNGDGVDDQLAGGPVATHAFSAEGYFLSRVTVIGAGASDVAFLEVPVAVVGGGAPGELIFADGFESGDLSRWTVP